jgi:hypothetical protein
MGTRSLLGYERQDGKIYAQYQQFDGYPDTKGVAYYVSVLKGLEALEATDQAKNPSASVFKRIQHYLNEAQYASGHSVGAHNIHEQESWFNGGADCWQEWMYLFDRNGNFIFFHEGKDQPHIVIPWEFTRSILAAHEWKNLETIEKSNWWEKIRLEDYDENKKVLKWGSKAPLHLHDELNYDSSKALRDELLKGNKPTLDLPVMSLDVGEILAFPEQKEHGYRTFSVLTIETTKKEVVKSMFTEYHGKRKNEAHYEVRIQWPKKK